MNHFHCSWDFLMWEISFVNLQLLFASIYTPEYETGNAEDQPRPVDDISAIDISNLLGCEVEKISKEEYDKITGVDIKDLYDK